MIFGLTADEVTERRNQGGTGRPVIEASPELGQALEAISSGVLRASSPTATRW